MLWRYEYWDGKRKPWTKPPHRPDGGYADSTDPATWSDFDTVAAAYRTGRFDGVGVVLDGSDDLVGVDLDHCVEGTDAADWAEDVAARLRSYTEVSPSGTGLRVIVRGKLPAGWRKHGDVEVYETGRYLTITGHALLPGVGVERRQEALEAFHAAHAPPVPKATPNPNHGSGFPLSDRDALDLADRAANGTRFAALYRGDDGAYNGDTSAGDLAFISMLAFYTRDEVQLDRIYHGSGRARPKWDERRGEQTYGLVTIDRAVATVTERYEPHMSRDGRRPDDPPPPEDPHAPQHDQSRNHGEHGAHGEHGRSITLMTASQVSPRRTAWVDDGRIPLGALSLVAGEPGLGKSIYTGAELAARVSRGQAGGDLGGPAHVVVASAEDAIDYTLVPRLIAAGANLDYVHFVRVTDDGATSALSLPSDIDELWGVAATVNAKLVAVDPVAAHLDGSVDSHRDASTRKALAPLATMADDLGCAVVGIVHVNKTDARNLFLRVGGSLAFFAAARSVLLIARDPADPDEHSPRRVLVHGKCNVGMLAVARRFAVERRTITAAGDTFDTAGITWGGDAPEVTSSAALAGAENGDERSERTEAEEWLRELLDEQGEIDAVEAKKAARKAGIAERTLDRARRGIGAVSRRTGFGKGAVYVWTMPDPSNGE